MAIKKYISIFLLTILSYSFGGYVLVLHLLQDEIKKESRDIIQKGDENEFVLLKLSKAREAKDLIYHESDEVFFKGKLYDIASKSISGDSIYLYCYNDTKEETLLGSMDEMVSQNAQSFGDNAHNGHNDFSKSFLKDFLPVSNRICFTRNTVNDPNKFFDEYATTLADPQVIVPPPKQLFS